MPTIIQFRRDEAADWISADPVLAEGELGVETDTLAYKVGDGVQSWTELPYRELTGEFTSLLLEAGSDPSTPAAGHLILYAKEMGGRVLPKIKGPSGLDTPLQPAVFANGIQMLAPASSTAFSVWGMSAPTAVGTVSHPALASGSLRTQTRRAILTSAATANSASELRHTLTTVWRGDAAGQGGFHLIIRFGVSSTTSLQRVFVGLASATGAISTSQAPSALTNILGVGWDSADTNLQVMNNDGSGTATKTDLGSDFPANTQDAIYELTLFAPPNETFVKWRVKRLDTGTEASGTISTDMPAAATFLTWHAHVNNGGTAAAVILDIYRVYIETDY